MRFSTGLLLGLTLGALSIASPLPNDPGSKDKRSFVERDGTKFTVFEHAATGAKLEFVKNSGICETTPGVNQYSGYLSVGTNENTWFWLYVADPLIYETSILSLCTVSRHATTQPRRLLQLGSMAGQDAPVWLDFFKRMGLVGLSMVNRHRPSIHTAGTITPTCCTLINPLELASLMGLIRSHPLLLLRHLYGSSFKRSMLNSQSTRTETLASGQNLMGGVSNTGS